MLPPVVTTRAEVRTAVFQARQQGKAIGLAPTMGALHAGHASLIRTARVKTDFVVVSIFVNPTQFRPGEDYDRYPRTLEADRELCGAVGCDLIFAPSVEEIYPPGFCTYVEVVGLQDVLCGASRTGHFRGVATVVLKLFQIIRPDVALFGQKDAQQVRIIKQLVRDLDLPVMIDESPTVREPDGLAMSSRNRYLDPSQRAQATVLFRSLEKAKERVMAGERSVERLENLLAKEVASTPGAKLDYARIVDAESLQSVSLVDRPVLAAMAVYFGATRLIDNAILCLNDG